MLNENSPNSSKLQSELFQTQLMLGVQNDVPGAFEELVTIFQKRVYRVMLQLVGNREEAEDLTQELFLRVFRSRKKYRVESKLGTWIFTIAHNIAFNALRSRHRSILQKPRGLSGAGTTTLLRNPELNVVSPGGTPSAHMRSVELSQVVHDAIQTLNDDQRMAIVLNKFEEMSYAEIAEVMGRSELAIKSLLSRARVNLKDQLASYLDSGVRPMKPHQADDGGVES